MDARRSGGKLVASFPPLNPVCALSARRARKTDRTILFRIPAILVTKAFDLRLLRQCSTGSNLLARRHLYC